MTRPIALRFGLGAVGALLLTTIADAGPPLPCKVDWGINWHCHVQYGPQAYIPRAPWYTYFPADANLLAQKPGTTPYPTWPSTFPPAPGGAPEPKQPPPPAPKTGPNVPLGYYYPSWGLTPSSYTAPLQPVGYMPAQVPSYWYGR
jgi:hypothetical protein